MGGLLPPAGADTSRNRPMDRTKIGIIGCGNISEIYCLNAARFPNTEVVACADIDPQRAKARAAKHGVPKALSVEDLLADPEVQIAVNLTVPTVHAEISRRVLEAGKHVYSGNRSPPTARMPPPCWRSPGPRDCAWAARPTRSWARGCRRAVS